MGQNLSGPTAASNPSASQNELDQFVDASYEQTLVHVDGITSFNLGLDDIFLCEHYHIPELERRQMWCFKVMIRASGATFVDLRTTNDLAGITALSYTWGEMLRDTSIRLSFYKDGSLCEVRLGYEWSIPSFISALVELSANSWL